jgi:hypothetical protein
MRRVISLVAAMALAVSMSGPSVAAGPPSFLTHFYGSFDTLANGVVVGHTVARIWPSTADKPTSGTYSTWTLDGKISSSAQLGDVVFNRKGGYNEVWFNGMEWGIGGTNGIFTGHFVDYLDPAQADSVEFYVRPVNDLLLGGAWRASLGDPLYFHFDVGTGVFSLVITG